jgi:hypothetical protein
MDDNLTFEQWYPDLSAKEQEMMRRGIRILLSRTFILREKERELFHFLARNEQHMETWFAPIGYTMFLDRDYGIIMLRDRQEEKVNAKETAGINRKIFTIRESVIYCALAWIFMERMSGSMDRSILIRPEELTKTLEQFGIGAGFRTEFNKTQIEDALKTLQRFSLLEIKGALGEEDCVLVLYPTLLFGLDLKAAEELLRKKKESYLNYYTKAPAGAEDEDSLDSGDEQDGDAEPDSGDEQETEEY